MRRALLRRAAPPLLGVLLIGGCGSSGASSNGVAAKAPAQIVAAAQAVAARAAAVHVAGSILGEGKPISLNMELLPAKGATGELALAGLQLQLTELDGLIFVRGNARFMRELVGARAARALHGRWLESLTRGPLSWLTQLTHIRTLIAAALARHGALSRGPLATIDGRRAIAVRDVSSHSTLYVAATGTPYPLEITSGGRRRGRIVFDRWNMQVTLAPPLDTVALNSLQGAR